MQKKIIALAVAGLVSGAAFAQSNVTVYGVADVYYGNFSAAGGQKVSALNSGGLAGSRVGFKGTEDLGNGLKALFTLEYNLAVDANSGIGDAASSATTQARQQFVGLTGGFGTAVAGRLQSPGYGASAKFDAHAASVLSPLGQLTDAAGMSISGRDALARFSNAVAYVSPNFGGVTVTAAYSFVGEQATDPRSTGWTLSADYDNGPIAVNYTHVSLDLGTAATAAVAANPGICSTAVAGTYAAVGAGACVATITPATAAVAAVAAFSTDVKENALFGSYDLGAAKLIASWQSRKSDAAGVANGDATVWNLGTVIPVGAGAVRLSYAKYDNKLAASTADAVAYGIAYTHGLSKRTTAYAGYTLLDNKNAAAFALGGATPTAGGNVRAIGMGLNHSF